MKKDKGSKRRLIEIIDRARAERVPFGLALPETAQTRKGLNILATPTRAQARVILRDKTPTALQQWAMETMGKELPKFMDDGLRFFFFSVMVYRAIYDEESTPAILQKIPFIIPLKLGKSPLFPVDPSRALQEYQKVIPEMQTLLKKTRRQPAKRKLALIKQFGISKKNADKYVEDNSKASIITFDYIARKFWLPFGGEALKKYASLARNPEQLIDRMRRDFDQRTSAVF